MSKKKQGDQSDEAQSDQASAQSDQAAEVLTLSGHAVHVFEHFEIDGEPLVHAYIAGETTPRVMARNKFDDQSGWDERAAERAADPIEDPAGLGDQSLDIGFGNSPEEVP